MTLRYILAPVFGRADDAASLKVAAGLALRFGAHLEALHVRPDPNAFTPVFGEGMSAGMIEDMMKAAEREAGENAKRASAAFAAATRGMKRAEKPAAKGATAQFREETGQDAPAIARRGRLVDLLVLARPGKDGWTSAQVAVEAALFDTGRPVLLVPPDAPETVGTRIVVAWNGSGQAARAAADAMPFLESAEAVEVVSAKGPGELAADPKELAAALGWRGIEATASAVETGRGGAGSALLKAAARADLLVMGAYGHSRLRELILGGATRAAVETAPLPVLLSH